MYRKILNVGLVASFVGASLFICSVNNKPAYQVRKKHFNLLSQKAQSWKGNAEYLKSIRANQITGTIPKEAYLSVLNELQHNQNNKSISINWRSLGPDNIGGRTRAILVDKNDSNTIYAASVTGGVFVSHDNGGNWQVYNSDMPNLAVDAICQTANGNIFVATGSSFDEPDGTSDYTGTAGGFIYELTGNGNYTIIKQPSSTPVNSLATNYNRLAAYGNRIYCASNSGLLESDPDGNGNYTTWNLATKTSGNPLTGNCQDVVVGSDGSVITVFKTGRIYHSPDGASNSFVESTTNMSTSGFNARTTLAIAPSDPNIAYASVATGNGGGSLKGVYRSSDGGQTWQVIGPGGSTNFSVFSIESNHPQGHYDNCIAVFPNNPNKILVGGIELWEWTMTQSSPTPIGSWVQNSVWIGEGTASNYVHADKHTIVFKNANTVFIGCDGGIFRSDDGAQTYTSINFNYTTTQLYDVATTANGNGGIGNDVVMGGAQDNGTFAVGSGISTPSNPHYSISPLGGDGFDCAISDVAPIAFGTVYNNSLTRIVFNNDNFTEGTMWDEGLLSIGVGGPFYSSIQYWDTKHANYTIDSIKFKADTTYQIGDALHYYSATNDIPLTFPSPVNLSKGDSVMLPDFVQSRLALANVFSANTNTFLGIYITRDAVRLNKLPEWFLVCGAQSKPDAGPTNGVNAMAYSPDGNYLFVGTLNGRLYRISGLNYVKDSLHADIRSAFCNLTCNLLSSNFNGQAITGISVDQSDGNKLIVTTGNYGNSTHVYRCTNALSSPSPTFTSIQGTGLPAMPVYDAVIDVTNPNRVILATDWGCFATENAFSGVVQWQEVNNGLGHVPVFAITQEQKPWASNYGAIYIGTHGRGFFTTDNWLGVQNLNKDASIAHVSTLKLYPNPANNFVNLDFNINARSATIQIFDLKGSLVKVIKATDLQTGSVNHKKIDVSNLQNGTYLVSIMANNQRKTAKMVILR